MRYRNWVADKSSRMLTPSSLLYCPPSDGGSSTLHLQPLAPIAMFLLVAFAALLPHSYAKSASQWVEQSRADKTAYAIDQVGPPSIASFVDTSVQFVHDAVASGNRAKPSARRKRPCPSQESCVRGCDSCVARASEFPRTGPAWPVCGQHCRLHCLAMHDSCARVLMLRDALGGAKLLREQA